MNPWLAEFESIGDNCEFGFVQEKLGVNCNTLLRWAFLDDVASTSVGIRKGFEGVFAFENLVPAGNGTMVRDVSAGIAFPSAMRSELRDGSWQFIQSEAERRRIHREETLEFNHLRHKFLNDLAGGKRIYVVKRNDDLTQADAEELLAAITVHGRGRLLYVTVADARHAAGTAELVNDRLAHGWVDRFASYLQADDVSSACWEAILRATAARFREASRRGPDPVRRLAPQIAPVAAPTLLASLDIPLVVPGATGEGSGDWTAYAPVIAADLALQRALAAGPHGDGGDLLLDERPRPASWLEDRKPRHPATDALYDDAYYVAMYPELADAAVRERETEEYFSPAMLELGARLRRGTESRYQAVSTASGQIDVLRHLFAPSFYARLLGWPDDDADMLWKHYQTHGLPAGVPPTPLFNPVHYRREVAASGLPAPHAGEPLALHWLRAGMAARLVPTWAFDQAFYDATYPDIAKSGTPSFWHYLTTGMAEGRAPTVWFDPAWYSAQGDKTHAQGYDHFIGIGLGEGRMPSALVAHILSRFAPDTPLTADTYRALVTASRAWSGRIPPGAILILTNLYVPQWHDRAERPLDGFLAYLRDGLAAGRRPGPLFDEQVYRQRAAAAGLPPIRFGESAVEHWLRHGQETWIVPTERFDEVSYHRSYPDITRAKVWGFAHFVNTGIYEGRAASTGPVFQLREPLRPETGPPIPDLYRHWHALDFPDATGDVANAIPLTAHRRLDEFLRSDALAEIFAEAQAIDPAVGEAGSITDFVLPPYHDPMALRHAEIERRMPRTHYDSVVCVPWVRTGGADLVAALLAKALRRVRPHESVLVLRVDHPHFERGNWLPDDVDVVDISDHTSAVPPEYAEELLRTVLRGVTARRVFNVNSRLCWITLRDHGRNLAATLRTYAYMFCWDQTPSGVRAGYPAEFFAETCGHVTAFLTDTNYLRNELTAMYRLPPATRERIVPMFTPAQTGVRTPSVARTVEYRGDPASRKLVLWAGRLDRQKRFDLVRDIAGLMPDVTFRCWGIAVLDAPPDLSSLSRNIVMEGSFDSFDDLPLAEAGAWLFTALWEGTPTTIIELAARGVPIVASAVGGVPELIQPQTGWLVPETASAADYAEILRDALSSPAEARRRAEALQARVAETYNEAVYDATLRRLLDAEDGR